MGKRFQKALFLFRRDLRLEDNTGLTRACQESEQVLCAFLFDPAQKNHCYFSAPGFAFMLESLSELSAALKKAGAELHIFAGQPEAILGSLLGDASIGLQALYFNADYTPFARGRDQALADMCQTYNRACIVEHDALLQRPGLVLKKDGSPYTVFTAYKNKAVAKGVLSPLSQFSREALRPCLLPGLSENQLSFSRNLTEIPAEYGSISGRTNMGKVALVGGRKAALGRLKKATAIDYQAVRDFPARQTSRLSADLKFGTLSVREVYHTLLEHSTSAEGMLRELYWRDFFCMIGYYFPHVFQGAFDRRYDRLAWQKDSAALERWQSGTTGFPLVDAGMRELKTTGFMHNRVRMVTASFLVKDLHISWRTGEEFFARSLVDYDPAVNNGNWQWVASTGCDRAPYFRIFNPWTQQKRFDPDCTYIKQWIPELADLSPRAIHNLATSPVLSYPAPMLDHKREAQICLGLYRKVDSPAMPAPGKRSLNTRSRRTGPS